MTSRQNIAETIGHAADGNEAAQQVLYQAHYAAAFRLTCLLLQDVRDAEEVVQDAFVYLFRNLRRYDPERGSIWTWLRVILVSRCRNKYRRRQLPLVSLEALDAADQAPAGLNPSGDPVYSLEMRGAQRAVWGALQRVSRGAREALILRYYEGLPYAEIATLLACSPDAARARVAHGKVQLRRLLTESQEGLARESGTVRVAKAG
jgi:RNA polymerase sigma-70 factor (ECF subfamily)